MLKKTHIAAIITGLALLLAAAIWFAVSYHNQHSRARARQQLMQELSNKDGPQCIDWFLESTAKDTPLHWVRADLTVAEAMDLYSHLCCMMVELREMAPLMEKLVTELPIFRNLVAVFVLYSSLVCKTLSPLQNKNRPTDIPTHILDHIEEFVTTFRAVHYEEDEVRRAVEDVNIRLHPPFDRVYPDLHSIASHIMRVVDADDDLFNQTAGVETLLRYGILFPSSFVSRMKDPKKIAAFFPLLTGDGWIQTFRSIVYVGKYDHARSLLQVPGFIRVIRYHRDQFCDNFYDRELFDWQNGVLSFAMQQPFFAALVNFEHSCWGSLLKMAIVEENFEMMTMLLGHEHLVLDQAAIDKLFEDDSGLIENLIAIKEKNAKMMELMQRLHSDAIAKQRLDIAERLQSVLKQ